MPFPAGCYLERDNLAASRRIGIPLAYGRSHGTWFVQEILLLVAHL